MVVLFVNHKQENCGVYQLFKRLTAPVILAHDTYFYIETNEEWEHDYWVEQLKPDIVVYNFYFSGSTMPWLTNEKVAQQRGRFKQLCLFHEGNIDDKGFDLILHQNPVNIDTRYFNLPRPIPEYLPRNQTHMKNVIPVIGTFGFGLGGKGFTRVVETVNAEFDQAIIRMNIPYAHFGDADGTGARWWANASKALAKPGIEVIVTHDMLPERRLLDFLANNDINAFLYDDNIGRGISGTLDYALAVHKPIAITKSWQFQHMWNDVMIIEPDNGLKDIMAAGTAHLDKYHKKWNTQSLIQAFNQAFERVR
jgi:hypothetical protein